MAITLQSDMKVYDPRVQGGYRERLNYIIDAFNASSLGCINLTSLTKPGDYDYKTLWARVAGIVNRRDNTSTSAATPTKSTQAEQVAVKVNRRIGPHDVTRNSLLKIGINPDDDGAKFALGEFVAEATLQDRIDTALYSLRAALYGQSAIKKTVWDVSTPVYVTNQSLVDALALKGDRAAEVELWVMHSAPWFKLIGNQLSDKVTGIANVVLVEGSPITMNRPVLVMDSPALVVDNGSGTYPLKYQTLGLTRDAITVTDTEEEYIVEQEVLGNEQIFRRMQGEYAYNLEQKGFTWDVANGGANPTLTALKTSTNWDLIVSSIAANGGGVVYESN